MTDQEDPVEALQALAREMRKSAEASDLEFSTIEKHLEELGRALKKFTAPNPTPKRRRFPKVLACSFCSKTREEVSLLIAGSSAAICPACVFLSVEVILERATQPVVSFPAPPTRKRSSKPKKKRARK